MLPNCKPGVGDGIGSERNGERELRGLEGIYFADDGADANAIECAERSGDAAPSIYSIGTGASLDKRADTGQTESDFECARILVLIVERETVDGIDIRICGGQWQARKAEATTYFRKGATSTLIEIINISGYQWACPNGIGYFAAIGP